MGQLNPKVLFSAAGYRFGGRWIDKGPDTDELLRLLGPAAGNDASAPHLVMLDDEGTAASSPSRWIPSSHPCRSTIRCGCCSPRNHRSAQGHRARSRRVLLEHLKAAVLHADLGGDDVSSGIPHRAG